jgi:hypothetical protein
MGVRVLQRAFDAPQEKMETRTIFFRFRAGGVESAFVFGRARPPGAPSGFILTQWREAAKRSTWQIPRLSKKGLHCLI